ADVCVEDLGAEADTAHVLAHVLRPRLRPGLSRGEVHAQELSGVAGHGGGSGGGLALGSRGGRGRAHWTITDWGSWGEWDVRPRIVRGRSLPVVCVARNAGLTSKGLRFRCAFHAERSAPEYTRPLSIPTSFVVQMSSAGPPIIAPRSF